MVYRAKCTKCTALSGVLQNNILADDRLRYVCPASSPHLEHGMKWSSSEPPPTSSFATSTLEASEGSGLNQAWRSLNLEAQNSSSSADASAHMDDVAPKPSGIDPRAAAFSEAFPNPPIDDAAPPSAGIDPRVAAVSGATSGALASIATHPLDVVRTKLAVQRHLRGNQPPRYKGTFGTLSIVFREEGMRGLFRGIAPAVVSHAPAAAIFFSTYSFLKANIPDSMTFPIVPREASKSSYAAGGGWLTTCLLLNPLFVLKTKQQTQLVRERHGAPLKYSGLLSSFRVVVSEQGLRGLYAGTAAAMAGFPGAMVQMPLYEYLKRSGNTDPSAPPPSHARVAISSASSASFVGIIMYPIEVVRLRLQAQGPATSDSTRYNGIFDAFRKIYHSEGIHAFHRGLGTGLIRTVPQSAIGLSCYEAVLRISTALLEMWESKDQESKASFI